MRPLLELSEDQWEDLCDGCGRCCMVKLQDAETDELFYTNIACEYLERQTCRCKVYPERMSKKPECLTLTKESLDILEWLPNTCAYRRFDQQQPPLDIKDITMKSLCVSENEVPEEDYEDHIIDWIKINS